MPVHALRYVRHRHDDCAELTVSWDGTDTYAVIVSTYSITITDGYPRRSSAEDRRVIDTRQSTRFRWAQLHTITEAHLPAFQAGDYDRDEDD